MKKNKENKSIKTGKEPNKAITVEEIKPDDILPGSVSAHLVIKDKMTGKVLLNTRG